MDSPDADLADAVLHMGQPRVLVIGDAMLDRYIWGDAARISQEAPVILLRADRREERLGGASSVTTMLRALGAKVLLAGVVGEDADGERIRRIVQDHGIDDEALLIDPDRPSTVKERYIGRAQHRHPQQMMRVDYEVRSAISPEMSARLGQILARQIRHADIVLISDYDKGVCTPELLSMVIREAKTAGVRVIADPIRGGDYRKYHGCSAMTPNRLEAGMATNRAISTLAEAMAAATELRDRLGLEAGIVTLDRDGMVLSVVSCQLPVVRKGPSSADNCQLTTDNYSDSDNCRHFPTRPRQVYDITGAGDMVLAVLGMGLAAGLDYPTSIRLANIAGGLEVEKVGVATVTREEILRDILHGGSLRTHAKVVGREDLVKELERRRAVGHRVAFTNGCFDVLHAGHVQYLCEARAQADLLVVGLNSDASVRSLKGPTRPVNACDERALVLAGLEAVDFLAVFEEQTPWELIQLVRPDVLVKGADYQREQVVGGEFVESYGGRVHLATLREGFSTTRLLKRLEAA